MPKLTAEEIKRAARAAALRVADRDKDGDFDRKDVEVIARAASERFPIGVIVVSGALGAVLGFVVRGLVG